MTRDGSVRRRPIVPIALAGALALAACGGSGDDDRPAPPAKATDSAPSALDGAYTTRLHREDIPPDAPRELVDGGLRWTLTISGSGGTDDAPVFTIASDQLGTLETSTPVVSPAQVELRDQECAATGTVELLDNTYGYRLAGSQLTFETVMNRCADKVAETILTSRRWTKQR